MTAIRRRTIARSDTYTHAYTAPTTAPRQLLNQMTPDEIRTWIHATRRALEQKQARERAYLDRRIARGTHTPTDDAYEQDQLLEADLLAMLDEMETSLC